VVPLMWGLRQYDEALTWLERAVRERTGAVLTFRVDPRFDCLRSESRFQRVLQDLQPQVGVGSAGIRAHTWLPLRRSWRRLRMAFMSWQSAPPFHQAALLPLEPNLQAPV